MTNIIWLLIIFQVGLIAFAFGYLMPYKRRIDKMLLEFYAESQRVDNLIATTGKAIERIHRLVEPFNAPAMSSEAPSNNTARGELLRQHLQRMINSQTYEVGDVIRYEIGGVSGSHTVTAENLMEKQRANSPTETPLPPPHRLEILQQKRDALIPKVNPQMEDDWLSELRTVNEEIVKEEELVGNR